MSLINLVATLAGAGKIQAFKTMRTLRALRPLRAMSRMQGMRVSAPARSRSREQLLHGACPTCCYSTQAAQARATLTTAPPRPPNPRLRGEGGVGAQLPPSANLCWFRSPLDAAHVRPPGAWAA